MVTGLRLNLRRGLQICNFDPLLMENRIIISSTTIKMRYFYIIFLFLLLGCSDTVRTEFKTLDEAKQAKAFERGWLPPILPDESVKIVEINNLDSNQGHGSFEFPIKSMEDYMTKVREAKDSTIDRKDGKVNISIRKDKMSWKILLDEKNGHGKYNVEQ